MASLLGLQPPSLLQTVLDNVGVALAVIDREGRFVFTNQAALKMLGVTGDLNGVSWLEWRRRYLFRDQQGRPFPAEHAPIVRLLAGEEVEPQEVGVTLPDGSFKWLHAAAHPFSILGMSGVFMIIADETERVELRRAMERTQRMEDLGLLAGGLAHDFNNMLSVLAENVALARSDHEISESMRVRLQGMATAIEKGSVLATKFVQYSRAAHAIQICPVQIDDIVNVALELTRPLLRDRIRVKSELGPGLPAVEADPGRMEQVLVNLILNAIDAMPNGGELIVHTELVTADLVSDDVNSEAKKFIAVSIADTGVGIPQNLHTTIFDPFFTTKPAGKGTGLGLASAIGIVRQHNGHIKVESTPGVGTKFSIYLPVGDKAAARENSP